MEDVKPTVTWEVYCQVTQLCTEVLRDNAQLRAQLKMASETLHVMVNQQDELWAKLNELGYKCPQWQQ
jgi:hypothetical protein